MAKAKKRTGKKKSAGKKKAAGKKKKSAARRKPAARRKAARRKPPPVKAAAAPAAPRPVVIPGAWPFPMASKP
jgi:hypothetical protein